MFPPSTLPLPGEIILLTDELLASADFMLHYFLATHIKGSSKSAAVLISQSEDVGRWKSIAGRLNVNLSTCLDSGRVTLVDTAPHINSVLGGQAASTLRDLFFSVRSALNAHTQAEKDVLVIIDDLTSIEWVGVSVQEITRFARTLCALCRQHRASLIIRHHAVTPGEPDELLRHLLQLCDYHLDIFALSSGRSGAVSGQVALHCGPATSTSAHRLVTRKAAVHYRLTDGGGIFFERGTGNGVL